MMRLLSGVALAALIAAPVWAQTPTSTPNPNTPATTQNAPAPATTKNAAAGTEKSQAATSRKEAAAKAPAKHREMRHAMRHQMRHAMRMPRHGMRYAGTMQRSRHWHRYSWHRGYYGWGPAHGPTDFVAQQLNRQELGQIYSGGGMPPVPAQPSGY